MPTETALPAGPASHGSLPEERAAVAVDVLRELFLLRSEHRLHGEMLDQLDAALLLVELPSLRVLACNQAYSRLLDVSSAAPGVEGTRLPEHFPEYAGGILDGLVQRTVRSRETVSALDVVLPGLARRASCWSIKIAPLTVAEGGAPERLLVTLTDTSERRRLEDELRQAQKMEVVGELAGGIAHDFNNLLTVILGNVPLALADLPPDHPAAQGLRDSEVAARRAAELTRQLLTFSRRSSLQPRALDLNELVEEAVRLLAHTLGPRVEIESRLARELWQVRADPSRMSQMLINLCVNARDAMPEGGKLSLATRNVTRTGEPAGSSGIGRQGDFVELTVRDTGRGMTPDVMARIYEPFFTTKGSDRGTGLGLSVVFGIVRQHGGWIECESAPGHGTCFGVYLPRLEGAAAASRSLPSTGAPGGTETVLLVEDEEVVRTVAQTILERKGYRVLVAGDGHEALEVFRRHRADIALVVLDLAMPKLEGGEVLRDLLREKPDLRVIIATGYVTQPDREHLEKLGASAFLDKPFRPDDLAACVREVLDRAGR